MPFEASQGPNPGRICPRALGPGSFVPQLRRGIGRRRQFDGGCVGPGSASSALSRQRPAASFSTAPVSESRRKRSPVLERLASAALASAATLRPGVSRIADRSRCSADPTDPGPHRRWPFARHAIQARRRQDHAPARPNGNDRERLRPLARNRPLARRLSS